MKVILFMLNPTFNTDKKIGYFYVDTKVQHSPQRVGHPESPNRLSLAENQVKTNPVLAEEVIFISQSDIIEGYVEMVHSPRYIEKVKRVSKKVKRKNWYLDQDTYVDSETYKAAYLAASTACLAAQHISDDQIKHAFCAIRPPGHHASYQQAAGYCIFNNAVIASRFFLNMNPISKILIVDWDTHFGNGTYSLTRNIEPVYFFDISTTMFPINRKYKSEANSGATLIEIKRDATQDNYLKAFAESIDRVSDFVQPDMIVISAGFDTHKEDPMQGFSLTTSAYYEMTRKIMDSFQNTAILSVLEGGYNPEALALSIEQHLLAFTSHEE